MCVCVCVCVCVCASARACVKMSKSVALYEVSRMLIWNLHGTNFKGEAQGFHEGNFNSKVEEYY